MVFSTLKAGFGHLWQLCKYQQELYQAVLCVLGLRTCKACRAIRTMRARKGGR
jgi:hypothetical protein